MFTVEHDLLDYGSKYRSEILNDISWHAREEAAVFYKIEFNIVEARDITYKALISENQKNIFLKNVDALIAIYLKIQKVTLARNFFYQRGPLFRYHGLTRFFHMYNERECKISICEYIFNSICDVFYAIEWEQQIDYSNDNSLPELAILIKSYLKYLGREDEVDDMMQRLRRTVVKGGFHKEEYISHPLKKTDRIVVPADSKLPKTIKYEVRQEIDGLFYATVSEESALEFIKCGKELVKIAYDNYQKLEVISYYKLKPVFFDTFLSNFEGITSIDDILTRIFIMTLIISRLSTSSLQYVYFTRRHLEEIHILAQYCLEIGFFDIFYANFSKEIKDPAQLAKLIDTHFKTLDPPTGSKTKPAVRELL